MKQKITNIIGLLEMGIKTDEQAIAELLDLFSVINRRELLIAFCEHLTEQGELEYTDHSKMADTFLAINSL